MTRHSRTAAWLLLVTFGMTGTVFGGAGDEGSNNVDLARGERILVMQARDFFSGSQVVEGTGSALVQSVHNALVELELSPAPGSYAAVINAIGECERMSCAFLVLPRLERYTPKSTLRSKVRVTLELIEAASGRIVATCDATEMGWRHRGERVQELMRPAVEACLDRLITVKGGESQPAVPAMDQFLVAPFRELWVLPRNEAPEKSDYLADVLLDSLKRATYRGELGPSGADRRELFEHARKIRCNRILSVYRGLVWTHREKPPDDVRPQLIVSLVNVANEEIIRAVVLEASDLSWTRENSALLPMLMETAVTRLLNHPGPTVAPPEGIVLSLVEPATIIDDFNPPLPRSLRRKRPKGAVVVDIVVDEKGQVVDTHIAESVPELDKIVLRAVKRLRFLPARRDGEICPMHLSLRYQVDRK